MTALIIGASILAYLIIGHQIGSQSVRIWQENSESRRDQKRSFLSFLLFPLCHRRGLLGKEGEAAIDNPGYEEPGFSAMSDPRAYLSVTTLL